MRIALVPNFHTRIDPARLLAHALECFVHTFAQRLTGVDLRQARSRGPLRDGVVSADVPGDRRALTVVLLLFVDCVSRKETRVLELEIVWWTLIASSQVRNYTPPTHTHTHTHTRWLK
jgi:hypothetical protein